MLLIGQYDSPFVRRVAVSLHVYGMPFERRPLSVFGDFDAVSALNPLGKAPALALDDGRMLIDSTFILDHLDRMAGPRLSLTPLSGDERTEVQRHVAVALGLAEKSVEYRTETVRRPAAAVVPERVERIERQVRQALVWLSGEADDARGEWLFGARLTQADVTTGVAVTNLLRKDPELLAGASDALLALVERLEGLDAFAAAPFDG